MTHPGPKKVSDHVQDPDILRPLVLRQARLTKLWLAAALALTAAPLIALAHAAPASALNNGLALTPPMGWNDWNAYGCNVSEQLVEQTALAMHNDGLQAAGYQYVNIDDCSSNTCLVRWFCWLDSSYCS